MSLYTRHPDAPTGLCGARIWKHPVSSEPPIETWCRNGRSSPYPSGMCEHHVAADEKKAYYDALIAAKLERRLDSTYKLSATVRRLADEKHPEKILQRLNRLHDVLGAVKAELAAIEANKNLPTSRVATLSSGTDRSWWSAQLRGWEQRPIVPAFTEEQQRRQEDAVRRLRRASYTVEQMMKAPGITGPEALVLQRVRAELMGLVPG